MLQQHRSDLEFAHAAVADEGAGERSHSANLAAPERPPCETDVIMETLLRDYLKRAPRSTELAA